jgi:DNA-binding response OmpR family regulator
VRRPVTLILDANPESRGGAAEALALRGFSVEEMGSLGAALARLDATDAPAALLFDIHLPEATLPEALRLMASRHPALVIGVIGAAEAEEVLALELGADLCLPRPLPPALAAARLRASLRARQAGGARGGALGFVEAQAAFAQEEGAPVTLRPGLTFAPGWQSARRAEGGAIALTRTEAQLLTLLVQARGQGVSRERISSEVLGRPWAYADRTVDNLVLGLRRKLGLDPEFGPIRAVRNLGYRLLPAPG